MNGDLCQTQHQKTAHALPSRAQVVYRPHGIETQLTDYAYLRVFPRIDSSRAYRLQSAIHIVAALQPVSINNKGLDLIYRSPRLSDYRGRGYQHWNIEPVDVPNREGSEANSGEINKEL